MSVTFVDGDFNVPGCVCKTHCEFPCWQRQGLDASGTDGKCCCEGIPEVPDWIEKATPVEAFVVGAAQARQSATTERNRILELIEGEKTALTREIASRDAGFLPSLLQAKQWAVLNYLTTTIRKETQQ